MFFSEYVGADVCGAVSSLCLAESVLVVLAYLLEPGEGQCDKACVRFFEGEVNMSFELWGQIVAVFRSATPIFNLFRS